MRVYLHLQYGEGSGAMLRKCICLLCVLGVLPLTHGSAAEGSIQILPIWAGEPVAGGTVSIRKIGRKGDTGIVLTDGLADWCVEEDEILAGHWNLCEIGQTQIRTVKEGEGAVFAGLEEGVYLVRQEIPGEGFLKFQPFLVSIPEERNWSVLQQPVMVRNRESPKTGDHPAPIIGAMGIGLSVAFLMVLLDKNNR